MGDHDDEFKRLTRKEAFESMKNYIDERLLSSSDTTEANRLEMSGFMDLFKRFLELQGKGGAIDWSKIKLVKDDLVKPHSALAAPGEAMIPELLKKLVVVRLNGGLGTSMGCVGPKSIISVRSDLTFLDLTIQQIEFLNKTYDVDVPLVLMNSFNTDDDTRKVLRKYAHVSVTIKTFNQSRYPRFERESLLPVAQTITEKGDAWYPPGHGDIYTSLNNSGLLDELIKAGKEYMFVSNIDNLGATVDLTGYLFSDRCYFLR